MGTENWSTRITIVKRPLKIFSWMHSAMMILMVKKRFRSIGEESIRDSFYGDTDLPSFGEDGSDDVSKREAQEKCVGRQNKRKNPASIYADAGEYGKILEEESERYLQKYGDKSGPDRKKKKKFR